MKLTRIELCSLRVADGIATQKDFERLKAKGIDPEPWKRVSAQVRMGLSPEGQAAFSEEVMQQIISNSIQLPNLKELLADPENSNVLIEDIMGRVLVESSELSLPLMELLLDPNPPKLTDSIMGSILRRKKEEEDEEFFSEELVEEVFSRLELHDVSDEINLVPRDDDCLDIFPELSELIREEWGEVEEVAASFDAVLQQEVAKALSEDTDKTGDTKIVSRDESLIMISEEKPFVSTLERIEISEKRAYSFEDDSDEEILTLSSPEFITKSVLEEQAIRFPFKLDAMLSDKNIELDIWSLISSKIGTPPLRLIRDSSENFDNTGDFLENMETSSQGVEFLSTKTIDVDSTISKVSLWTLGGLMAIAAVWLIMVLPEQMTLDVAEDRVIEAFEVAEINSLEVEYLEVADDMEVQIFQGGEDAPTIIFIDSYPDGDE